MLTFYTFFVGYVTSTNIKILAMLSESIELNHELHLKTLFSKVHNLFVEYVLNPWSVLQSKIDSIRFNEGVDAAILEYSESSRES
jgi:Sedlin, N-terminal conserved region